MRVFAGCLNRLIHAALAMAMFASTAAQASDIRARLELLAREDLRVATIFARLQRAATIDCADKAPLTGLLLHDLGQYAPSARADAAMLFGLADIVSIAAVVSGSAADSAGLRAGDALLAIDGMPLPAVNIERRTSDASRAAGAAIARALSAGPARVRVIRNNTPLDAVVSPEIACAGRLEILPSDRFEAGTSGGLVTVTTALVEMFDADDPLAFLIAHELAHAALRHRRGEGSDQEIAADRLGLRIMARAGYDPQIAPTALTRLATARHQGWRFDPAHPALSHRLDALRTELHSIRPEARIPSS